MSGLFRRPALVVELANNTAAAKGPGMLGYSAAVAYVVGSAGHRLNDFYKSVEDYGALADGVTNCDAAIAAAVAATGGRFTFSGPGVYVCSASVWSYPFTAGDNVQLKVAGTSYVVSGAVAGPWRMTVDSPVLMSLRHAVSGNILQQWQDGAGGTATYFYRGLAFKTDSHFIQAKPATLNGSTDILFERSDVNVDPNGNRFNITFSESVDRLDISYATTASGAPLFDSVIQVVAGLSPSLTFPAIPAQFNLGIGVKQRAAGGFELRLIPTNSLVSDLKQIGGSGTTFMSFRDGAMGFFGSSGTSRIPLPVAAIDPTTTMALANALRLALINFGLCQ